MSDSDSPPQRPLDVADLRVIRALQLAPRASFAELGDVLGMHARTVARRYRSLQRDGILRIFGAANPLAMGLQNWQVRVRCRPDASEALASALADRNDVTWVGIAAAGSEISFSISSVSAEQRDLLLTRSLPRSAHVLDLEATVVLHLFLGLKPQDWSGLETHLTADETAALDTRSATATHISQFTPEPSDFPMLAELARDGRAGIARLAAAARLSEGRAARRLTTLIEREAVIIDVDLATAAFGHPLSARLHLQVAPARLNEVGQAVAELPQVRFVAATSGRHNLMAAVTARDLADLYEFTTTRIGTLDGIHTMEVLPFLRIVKQAGAHVADGLLSVPVEHRS